MSGPYYFASAADAYASNPTNHHHSNYNESPFDYPVRASVESPLNASLPIAGSGAYDARTTNSYGYARAPGEDHHDGQDDDDQDEDWNVYDDFNMTRPMPHRTSTSALASQNDAYWDASKPSLVETPYSDTPANRKSLLPSEAFGFDVRNADPGRSIIHSNYNAANRHSQFSSAAPNNAISGTGPQHADSTTGIELITVPALGNEYTKEELRDMTRTAKRRKKRTHRKKRCQLWVSGQDHLWGWLSPRVAVFLAFFTMVALGVLLFFVIPRVPTFAILSTNPVTAIPNGASMKINRSPTNFSMDMGFNLRANNRNGWIPSHATDLTLDVTDLNTRLKVGSGSLDSVSFKGRGNTLFQVPVHFSYVSLNASGDQTWQDFYQACGAVYAGQTRPTLNLALKLSMKITGLIGRKETNTQLGNVVCPFTLQSWQ
ncbi:uncharacterized protein UTRI_04216 [Ustilago trichophora]|uniref:Late embryogenesis abundant protein LEA-2 subgroup domain-containing protein n=1 Tax=Ustilago trichophora TaxID=86804 RepID=A0A5C3EPV2_9BASI|nr:uncharacterized protein UTRI_04216 [Ustilago trichophora]